MSTDDDRTLTETGEGLRATAESQTQAALVIAWSADEPHRIGEIGLISQEKSHSLGRGPGEEKNDDVRVRFFRQRPGAAEGCPPLESPRISRVQLRLVATATGLDVENVGRCPLLVNGVETTRAHVTNDDVLELGSQLVLVCTRRAAWTPPLASSYPAFPFGHADAQGIVGESPSTWKLRELIAFVARREGHVLVQGASGTGKELVARAVHALSARSGKPLIARNAATFPEGLIDAELFGNARNYPNSGTGERSGLVGEADGSTLFLDEFAELPSALQAHLLRVLDSGEYMRLGESRPRTSDLRLVAATNRPESDLKHDVLARMRFRVTVADLSERREDIPLLVRHLLRTIASRDPEAVARFFPGDPSQTEPRLTARFVRHVVRRASNTNVRDLDRIVWSAIGATSGDRLDLDVEAETAAARPSPAEPRNSSDEASVTAERVQATLDRNNGVIEDSWRELGLPSRHALARLIRKYGIQIRRSPSK